jgi:hypothetical protein
MADLKTTLGPDGYAELLATLQQSQVATLAQARVVQPATATPMSPIITGILKSWTVWFGGILVALPQIIPLISPSLQQALSAHAYQNVTSVVGIIVILLRFKTTQSLQAKGIPPAQATSA